MSAAAREAKVMKLVEFALEHKDDPDFNRLVFPADVLAKLAEHGVKVEPKTYTAATAIDRCYSMGQTETYTTNTLEIRDQSELAIEFPPVPPMSSPTSTSETKSPELEDSSSLPSPDVVASNVVVERGPSSASSPEPLPDRKE